MTTTLPYGSWPSPITPELIVEGAATPTETWADDGDIWWSESRPDEAGRIQIVRFRDGQRLDMLPDGFNARTRVHEYGGGAWWVDRGVLFFSNWEDQRIYRIVDGSPPEPITPEPPQPAAWRYADGGVTPDGALMFCVREDHTGEGEARNEIVVLPTDGSSEPTVVVSGRDFVSDPRPSPDGSTLAWITWDHPNMPWDTTELWRGPIERNGMSVSVTSQERLAGGSDESVVQPRWGPNNDLFVVSDRTNWWNIYAVSDVDALTPVYPVDAEVAPPQWIFGRPSYTFGADGALFSTWNEGTTTNVLRVDASKNSRVFDIPRAGLSSLRGLGNGFAAIATSVDREPEVVSYSFTDDSAAETVVKASRNLGLDSAMISQAEAISYPSAGGRTSHAFYYPPTNSDVAGPDDEKPPLLVMSHGGPTSAVSGSFNPSIQFWTSRGIAVVDVNYGGSTGYGRAYRELLYGNWGIVDVEDCCAAADYLVDKGLADPDRLAIRGGSAGGYTTLAALAFKDTFAAGGNLFGVSDIAALAEDTHKFESRYEAQLVGPWPEAADLYRERSPINHLDGFNCPLITFQGLEDVVVPPAQSREIMKALEERGIPNAYIEFEGEQHGFRRAENIITVFNSELSFYGQVFGFEPAGDIEPVEISHADALGSG
ncbi:MAG: S9 family peptidase [Armatimonadetes bacterium]|nr:MAG: S9 family peptidase [Armatimonadota bacterium]